MEFNSIPFTFLIKSIQGFFSKFSSLCSHPLFSTIITIYTLILLYIPSFFLRIVLSPVLNSTGIILVYLLKLGVKERLSFQESRILDSSANERSEKEFDCLEPCLIDHKDTTTTTNSILLRAEIDNKDRPYEINKCNLALCSSLVLEAGSSEPESLDLVDENQTNIEFKTKMYLDFGLESNQTHIVSKPKSSLDSRSNQMDIEFEHDLGSKLNSVDDYYKWELIETNPMESSQVVAQMEMDLKQVDTTLKFLEWNMKAPLEIIYEAYEGEEEEDEEESNENIMVSSDKEFVGCERYPSLSIYYPESETDSSSDADFPVNENWIPIESVFFKWEEEENDREELIEISLDRYGKKSFEFCHVEEDNLIEIDIFPSRN